MAHPTASGLRGRMMAPYRSLLGFAPTDISGLQLYILGDTDLLTEPGSRDFEGSEDQFFSVAAPATDYDLGTADFGMSVIIKRETVGAIQFLCGKYVDSENYWQWYIDASNILQFRAAASGTEVVKISGTTALSSTSAYYSVAVIIDRDSAANTKLYVDGADDTAGTSRVSATDVTLNTAFEVGRGEEVMLGDLSFAVTTTGTPEVFDMQQPLTGATISLTVDWGDGSSSTVTDPTDAALLHSYASPGTYTINATGTTDIFKFNNGGDKLKVVSVNKVDATTLGCSGSQMFWGCNNLASVATGALIGLTAVDRLFDSTAITTIPTGLFDNCPTVTSFSRTFWYCGNLTSIPTDLFKYNTSVTSFFSAFLGCSSITSIPTDLFRYNTSASNFYEVFHSCSSLTSIPVDLFRYNTSVTTFYTAFYGCSSLTSIPTDLFRYNTSVTNFHQTFSLCSSLTSIPIDTFRYNTLASDFFQLFSGCTSLTTIPNDMFTYNTVCTNYSQAFNSCALTETSVDNVLVSIDTAGASNGTLNITGGTSAAPSATGDAAEASLVGKGWTITTN